MEAGNGIIRCRQKPNGTATPSAEGCNIEECVSVDQTHFRHGKENDSFTQQTLTDHLTRLTITGETSETLMSFWPANSCRM